MENFEIINKLGSGGFSKVYKVRRKIDNQIYALKKVQILNLSEKQKLSSLNEIRVLASIKSKYVVNYKEAFLDEKDSTLCLVMEYADRGDLANRIKEQKKKGKYFNEKDIWRIFIQLVKGLKALHDLEILHRDIKSSNIFLFSDGTAKLGDLNVCKILSNNVLGRTQAGTPSYASPEVWMEKPYGLKSDIWSLGCVLYEIISLHCPFRGENVVELYNKILIGEYSRIPNRFSDELNWIIEHMINSDVNKRLSCDEILRCEYIRKRLGQNKNQKLKSNSNKKLKSLENEKKNNNNYNVNNENNNENNGNNNNNEKNDDNNDNIFKNNKNNVNYFNNSNKYINVEEKKENEQKLLKTIYMPNNLLYLSNSLPKPNYSQEIRKSHISKSNKPVKISSEFTTSVNAKSNKLLNSEEKRIHLSRIKKHTVQPTSCSPINSNLNSLFNISKSNNINDLNNNINIVTINNNINNKINNRGTIKLKHINSSLISSKKNNINSENFNNIYYRTGSQEPKRKSLAYQTNRIKEYLQKFEKEEQEEKNKNIENILMLSENREINDNDNDHENEHNEKEKEIEMKNHFFLDSDKLKAILCKKKVKKNHGHKKDLKFKLKLKNNEENENDNNNRYVNSGNNNENNDYKQVTTEINSMDNNYNINGFKFMNETNSINNINNLTNQKIQNYKLTKNDNQFIRNKTRKETFNNVLPKLKLSYIRRDTTQK